MMHKNGAILSFWIVGVLVIYMVGRLLLFFVHIGGEICLLSGALMREISESIIRIYISISSMIRMA